MIKSMTGFASQGGGTGSFAWTWELRAVNGKGLDLRLRVPDWVTGLESGLRKKLSDRVKRGNVTCNLRLTREDTGAQVEVSEAQLQVVLQALQQIERQAMDANVSLAPSKASDIVTMKGVMEQVTPEDDGAELARVLLSEFDVVLEAFDAMRSSEGQALRAVLEGQLDEIARLTGEAEDLSEARTAQMQDTLKRSLDRVLGNADGVDEPRLTQELALIAVKADVTEELDRLRAHVNAARDLLNEGGAVGRKLDFLMQEFNREANTLCSKAQMKELTAIGLALKAVIDQMREQVQNVE